MEFSHERQLAILKSHVDAMPTFSPATAKIVQLANSLATPPNEIVAAIRLDPVLTGKVLQLVNSAYFGLAQKVTSLNRAVVYLGINTIKNLALSTAVMKALDSGSKSVADLIRPTWRHSLATAVCAKTIAKAAQVPATMVEEYFMAGLLHDLGQIVLMQAFHATAPHSGKFSLEEEKLRYGLDHCEVGADTLRRWKFSEDLIAAIQSDHAPDPKNKLSYFIHVADIMTYRLKLNGEPEGSESVARAIAPDAWDAIGLSEAAIEKELESAPEQIEKAEVFLGIATSKEKIVEQL